MNTDKCTFTQKLKIMTVTVPTYCTMKPGAQVGILGRFQADSLEGSRAERGDY